MKKTIKKSDIEKMVTESVHETFHHILNEGYTSADAKRDLNIIGSYIWGLGAKEVGGEVASRKEAVNAYMNFTRRFWKKLEIFD